MPRGVDIGVTQLRERQPTPLPPSQEGGFSASSSSYLFWYRAIEAGERHYAVRAVEGKP